MTDTSSLDSVRDVALWLLLLLILPLLFMASFLVKNHLEKNGKNKNENKPANGGGT